MGRRHKQRHEETENKELD